MRRDSTLEHRGSLARLKTGQNFCLHLTDALDTPNNAHKRIMLVLTSGRISTSDSDQTCFNQFNLLVVASSVKEDLN